MNEVIVRYKNPKALKALEDLGKYLGFSVFLPSPEKQEEIYTINGVPVVKGDPTIDIQELKDVFSATDDIDATVLRKTAWQRSR